MKIKFDDVVTLILKAAFEEAKSFGHTLLTPEHVLHTAIRFKHIEYVFSKMNISISKLKYEVRNYLINLQINDQAKIENSPGFEKLLEKAQISCIKDGRNEISSKDIILALIEIEEQQSTFFFKSREVNVKTFEKQLLELNLTDIIKGESLRGISNDFDFEPEEGFEFQDEIFDEVNSRMDDEEIYKKYTVDLTEKLRPQNKSKLILRDKEIRNIIEILLKKNKSNPLIIGDTGVGKSAIIDELAFRIVNEKVPKQLLNKKILTLSVVSLVAGTRYRGDFEDRISLMLRSLEEAHDIILLLDDFHTFIQGSNSASVNNDYSIFIKPLLQETKVPVIGITNSSALKILEKEPSVLREFTPVHIKEVSRDDAQKILNFRKTEYEAFYATQYTPEVLKAIVVLSEKYLTERRFPEKAIECLDAIGATHITRTKLAKTPITLNEVDEHLSKVTGIPVQKITQSETKQLLNLEKRLKQVIFGQSKQIEYICQCLLQSRLGLKDEQRPLASLFFLGPTGVGKTELSKQIAYHLGINIIQFDMSEYQEKHSIARFIGAPPGYVGHEQGGALIDHVRKHPHSLILLDEFEKAHPDIYNLFLQIMDRALITDSTGRSADFRNCIVIMTSNVGAQFFGKAVGFTNPGTSSSHHVVEEINKIFTPEFRNRLDKFVEFSPITYNNSKKIIIKYLQQLKIKLKKVGVDIKWTLSVVEFLVSKGISDVYGARNLERTIREHLYNHISKYLISSKLSSLANSKNTPRTILIDKNNSGLYIKPMSESVLKEA